MWSKTAHKRNQHYHGGRKLSGMKRIRCIAAENKAVKKPEHSGALLEETRSKLLDNGAGRDFRGWDTVGKRVRIMRRKADDRKVLRADRNILVYPDIFSRPFLFGFSPV
jgi:hypothetical protein